MQRWSRHAARSESRSACCSGSVAFCGVPARLVANCGEADPELFQFFLRHIFEVYHAVFGPVDSANDLIKLDLHGQPVTVLAVLDDENHEKCTDGRASIDDHLPGF